MKGDIIMSKVKTIQTEVIETLSRKDYEKFQKNENSYQLYSWLKDELILCSIFGYSKLSVEPKALARIINIFASLRERGLVVKLNMNIKDSKTAMVDFELDLTTLDNRERRRLNQEYSSLGVNLEEMTEDEIDETYNHCF